MEKKGYKFMGKNYENQLSSRRYKHVPLDSELFPGTRP